MRHNFQVLLSCLDNLAPALHSNICQAVLCLEARPSCMQRDNLFYTALSYTTPATIMRLPYSATEAIVWTVLTYFVVGLAAHAGR